MTDVKGICRTTSWRCSAWSWAASSASSGRPVPSGLRTSQLRMLSMTPADGMRVTDLAERVGMTKQALGEFANELEEQGMLESVRDPADRRVRIVRPTRRGLAGGGGRRAGDRGAREAVAEPARPAQVGPAAGAAPGSGLQPGQLVTSTES